MPCSPDITGVLLALTMFPIVSTHEAAVLSVGMYITSLSVAAFVVTAEMSFESEKEKRVQVIPFAEIS